MQRSAIKIFAIFTSLFLAACGTTVSKKAFDPATVELKSIAITQIEVLEYSAVDWGHPGGVFAAGLMTRQSKGYHEKVINLDEGLGEKLGAELASRFSAGGVEVKNVRVENKKPIKLARQLPVRSDIDAYLDAAISNAGYSTTNIFDRRFRPDLRVSVQLVSAESGEVLYAENFSYGLNNPLMSGKKLKAEESLYYRNYGSLIDDYKVSFDRLGLGIEKIADQIANNLGY